MTEDRCDCGDKIGHIAPCEKKQFPVYLNHAAAGCFSCGADFGDRGWWSESGNPEGHGRYVQSCSKCGFSIWYDIEPPEERQRLLLALNRHQLRVILNVLENRPNLTAAKAIEITRAFGGI
jgi:hypothetical protein